MLHAVLHALTDTLVILPLLFVTYLIIELIEHKAEEKVKGIISASGKAGPILGSLIGLIPQCGFSGAAASFFAVGTVTAGTLVAVFLSTSDEMLPILISASVPAKEIVFILLTKFVAGALFGFVVDIIYKRKRNTTIEHMCESENCHCEHDGVFVSAIKHTLKIILIIFVVTCGINIIFELVGESNIQKLLISTPVIGELITALIGLIPNCTSSILLTDLYVENAISMGQLVSGVCVNAGVGLVVLFRANKSIRENLYITGLLYLFGVITGVVVSLFA